MWINSDYPLFYKDVFEPENVLKLHDIHTMSRQPTAGKFSFTKSIERRGSQRGIKSPDFAVKTQKKFMCT